MERRGLSTVASGIRSPIAVLVILVFFLPFGVMGLFILKKTHQLWHEQRKFFENAARVNGIVVRLAESRAVGSYRGRSRRLSYFPVVQFLAGERKVEFTAPIGGYPPPYRVGETVSVVYRPEDPTKANIDSWSSRWLPVTIASIVATGFILVGFGVPAIFLRPRKQT